MHQVEYKEITINPRVINHLGKDLITSSDVAVTELIKNSLDAKATKIGLHVFNDFTQAQLDNAFQFPLSEEISTFLPDDVRLKPIFVIEDDGKGMNNEQLDNGFLSVGTEIKMNQNEATLGEKGIGRLAAQRLGSSLLIETASTEEQYSSLTFVDWEKIGKIDGRKVPSIRYDKEVEHYTRIWIFGIRYEDFVEIPEQLTLDVAQEISVPINRELKSAINFLISPFAIENKNRISMYFGNKKLNVDFEIEMLQLSESKHVFSLKLDDAGNVLLEYSLNLEPWYIERVHRAMVKPEAFKRLKKTHIYYADLLQANRDKISNVLEKSLSEEEFSQILADVYEEIYEKGIADRKIREGYSINSAKKLLNNLKAIMPINGEIYSFKQNAAIGEHIIIEAVNSICPLGVDIKLKELKDFLAENNGIKLYRSKYRIGYLGNKESDWIKLQQFRTKGQQWYRFDLGNTLGYVSLTDDLQRNIREISSRLDIIQNETSESFKMAINVIFNRLFYELNRSANNILRVIFEQNGLLSESIKKQVKKNLNDINLASRRSNIVLDKLQKAISVIEEEFQEENVNNETINKVLAIMGETISYIEEEKKVQGQATALLSEASEQLKAVEVEAYNNFKLMANGLITETITHELDSVCNGTKISDVSLHFDFLKDYFIQNKDVVVFNKQVRPIRKSYDALSNKMLDVGSLYNFLEKTFIKKGTYDEFELQNISEIVANTEENLLQLKEQSIKVRCDTGTLAWFVPKGVLVHVFYNLFTNAMFWIDRRRKYALEDSNYFSEEDDEIVIEPLNDEEIVVYDTGTGVIREMQDVLFQPLESGKPDRKGRGMGLYIVQQLMRSFSADIQLLDEENRYGNRYKFLLSVNVEEK